MNIQVLPKDDHTVYFSDGWLNLYDVSHLTGKCVFDPARYIDIDSCSIYNEVNEVDDPLKGLG
jgi:hypothetical protein